MSVAKHIVRHPCTEWAYLVVAPGIATSTFYSLIQHGIPDHISPTLNGALDDVAESDHDRVIDELVRQLGLLIQTPTGYVVNLESQRQPEWASAPTRARRSAKRARAEVTLAVRWQVFKRDKFRCQYCGARAGDVEMHCDHRVSVANSGVSTLSNLVTACADCNLGKGSRNG